MATKGTNLVRLMERFNGEDKCHAYLEKMRWPEGVECPRCGCKSISRLKKNHKYDCNDCRYQFTVRVGTVLQDSKLPLFKWFLTTLIMVTAKKGVSAKQLERMIGVSYKTAWYLGHRIRAAMAIVNERQLEGTVEVDETWVGGKVRGKGRGYTGNKSLVLAAVERGGEIRLKVEGGSKRDRRTLHRFVRDHVADEALNIYADDWEAYQGLGDEDTKHESVNHSDDEWVRGEVHTNSVEGVISLLKRAVIGSYHQLSKKHLDAYLDEIEWRFNNRDNEYIFQDTVRAIVESENLEYKELTA